MPARILINVVDDDSMWQQLIKGQLSQYTVASYASFHEFMAHFSPKVDLVIMDVRLNDGTDVIDRIHTIYDISPNCYIIVVSAYLDVNLLQQLLRLRVNDTVVKGVDWILELTEAVDRLSPKLQERAGITW